MNIRISRTISALAAIALVAGLSACGNNKQSGGDSTKSDAQSAMSGGASAKPGEDKGFNEIPLGDEVYVGPLQVAAVYFQPVDMEPAMGVAAKDSSMHLEADIKAVKDNNLGYGGGDFIPALTVNYEILDKDGKKAQSGTMMPMNANDGPHYGLNIPKLAAGVYKVRLSIESPEKNGWMLHTDKATGVKGRFWKEPLVAEFDNWNWDPTAVQW